VSFETTTDEVLEGVDLNGKVAVVTGASTGLGLETARALAWVGAQVVLAGRDGARVAAAAATIRERVPDAQLEQGALDLTSLASVRAFADWYTSVHDRLHLLINNAGVMYTPFEHTAEGFEMQFGTNHVGHFLLTCLLVPQLLADPPSRVVNLSSGGHMGSDIVWDDVNFERRDSDKFAAYGQSKTANILFSVELDHRLGDRGVHAYAVHPGMIATELGRYMTKDDFQALMDRAKSSPSGGMPAYKTVEQGAATSVWAATAPELDDEGGTYLADAEVTDQHAPWARDPDSATRLWTLSEEMVGQQFAF
jgi:NAD(P)-dependent dehydrogenase (short-subunit alcohol dehydrogenase family)